MKTQIHLKHSQNLQLTPQMQQTIRLLQMSAQELEREVAEVLQSNPLLERQSTAEAGFESHRLTAAMGGSRRQVNDSEENAWDALADHTDFYQRLHEQVCEHGLNDTLSAYVHLLIENLDEHGYLKESLDDIIDNAPLEWRLDKTLLTEALECLQRFDPPGIGAADLQESLLLQLRRTHAECPQWVEAACAIVQSEFDSLGLSTAAARIKKSLGLPESDIQGALKLIQSLNPFPNSGEEDDIFTGYIEPDVWIETDKNGELTVMSNERASPKIELNPDYDTWLQLEDDPDVRARLQEAKQLILAVQMREDTIVRVARFILDRQADYFLFGDKALKPLLMTEAAAALELHESTISRAVNQKYLAYKGNLIELRHFFRQSATAAEDNEEGVSNAAIKAYIEEWIGAENKAKPLSDEAIAALLTERGMPVARRTVAKYRDQLRLPPAHQRRERD